MSEKKVAHFSVTHKKTESKAPQIREEQRRGGEERRWVALPKERHDAIVIPAASTRVAARGLCPHDDVLVLGACVRACVRSARVGKPPRLIFLIWV